ncbi:MAG: sugar nucleotide-binding protein [Acidobacteriota bacterium]|nr:sugar nucleotide-binding protein [Acidobacteriota bacterium]
MSAYGRTKLEGERQAARCSRHLIAHASWLYDSWGKNFLNIMMNAAAQDRILRAVDDERGAPTTCRVLANQLKAAAEQRWTGTVNTTCYTLQACARSSRYEAAAPGNAWVSVGAIRGILVPCMIFQWWNGLSSRLGAKLGSCCRMAVSAKRNGCAKGSWRCGPATPSYGTCLVSWPCGISVPRWPKRACARLSASALIIRMP